MKASFFYSSFVNAGAACFLFLCLCGCDEKKQAISHTYNYIKPDYGLVSIYPTKDTLVFPLTGNTYNHIESFNLFLQAGREYISFYDERSQSVNIYQLSNAALVKQLFLKNCLKGQELYNTSVYVKNFDSIFICNELTLHLVDGSGKIKRRVPFIKKPFVARSSFSNITPPVFKNGVLFTKARSYLNESSKEGLKKWKVMYSFNLHTKKSSLHYQLPDKYRQDIYGYIFFNYSYCYNDRGNFVFSFPADADIYETDLGNFYYAYSGRSNYQQQDIKPTGKKGLEVKQMEKNYLLNDSYGAIYFDPFYKRYLRVVKQKISEESYRLKNHKKTQRLVLFDQRFKIIGESAIDDNISLNALVFTASGNMYARTRANDEYALYFVRLRYDEKNAKQQLSKK